jgi:hypothetical protein
MPVSLSTSGTRRAGTSAHCDTACDLMPRAEASREGPQPAFFSSSMIVWLAIASMAYNKPRLRASKIDVPCKLQILHSASR